MFAIVLLVSVAASLPLRPGSAAPTAGGAALPSVVGLLTGPAPSMDAVGGAPSPALVTTTTTSTTTTTVTVTVQPSIVANIIVHVSNQYGSWINGAEVEVYNVLPSAPPSLSLVSNGTTTNGEYEAVNVTAFATYQVNVLTSTGGSANQTVTMGQYDAILNFVIPTPPSPTLSLQNVVLNASTATPGSPFSITGYVVNTSNSSAYNAILVVTPPSQFSLLNTGSVIPFGTLGAGQSKPLALLMSVSSGATTPGYSLAYVLNFSDYSGLSYKTTGSISLPTPPAPNLVVQNVSLSPQIIQPGTDFIISGSVVNTSNSTAFNSVLTITPPAGYSLLNTGSVIPIGTLGPGDSKALALELIVATGAAPTSNTLAYSLTYTDYFLNHQTTTGNLFVPISGIPIQPKLIVTSATFSSSSIHPGENFTVPITIQNVATVPADEVVLTVNATSPLVTTGSAGAYRLGVVPGNGTVSVLLGFYTPTAAALGSYPITLTLSYTDSFGAFYTNGQALVASIVGQPSLVFSTLLFKNNPLTPGLQTFLNAQVLNNGGQTALNVKVTFQNAPSFLANTTLFMGSIQSSKTGNATTYIQIPDAAGVGAYQFSAVISYTDPTGRAYQVSAPYTVTVAPFSPPQLSITNTLMSPEVLSPGSQGTMTIYLRNDGASPANNITLSIYNGSAIFSSVFFGLGTLDAGASGTTTVGVNVASGLPGGQHMVQIVARYNDANGLVYNFTLPLEVTVYASSSVLSLKTVGIILAIAIAGVLVYFGVINRRRFFPPKQPERAPTSA
jgi:hypothetical protein